MDAYHHWFNLKEKPLQVQELESLDIGGLASALALPEDIKYKLILTTQDYNTFLDEFILLFDRIYTLVADLRNRQAVLLETSRTRHDNIFFYRNVFEDMNLDIENFNYTVSLLNQHHFCYCTVQSYLYIGIDVSEFLQQKKEASLNSFAFIYDDPVRVRIVEFVNRCQPVFKYDIYEHMNMNKEIVYFHVDLLCEEGILLRQIPRDGSRAKFSVNRDYFKDIPNVFMASFGQMKNWDEKLEGTR